MNKTLEEKILEELKLKAVPLAEHEFCFLGTNGSSLTACLRKMRQKGLVDAKRRYDFTEDKFKKYKEWYIREPFQQTSFL